MMNILLSLLAEQNYWLTWGPPAILAALGIAGIFYKVLRILFRVDAALPTLLAIAEEFKPNGGNSLKDHLDRLDRTIDAHIMDHERINEALVVQVVDLLQRGSAQRV